MLSYRYADSNFKKGAKTAPIMGFFIIITVIFFAHFLAYLLFLLYICTQKYLK